MLNGGSFARLGLFLALVCIAMLPARASQADVGDVVFKEVEKRLIRAYFGTHDHEARPGKATGKKHGPKKLPPGLAKRHGLPPGLAKRHQLPPGLAKRALPDDLVGRLPHPPDGTERAIIDNNVVLIQKATGIVLDILEDAAKRSR